MKLLIYKEQIFGLEGVNYLLFRPDNLVFTLEYAYHVNDTSVKDVNYRNDESGLYIQNQYLDEDDVIDK